MTSETKKRIAAINSGIIPEGYKKTKVGIVPVEWEDKIIEDYLVLSERPIILEDSEEYELVTVRRGFVGVDSRGKQLGESILVKNYYQLKENDFLISKRQIAHGACGIVPLSLSGAVVSNEYNVFTAKKDLDVFFFNMLMQHPYYKRLFYLMSDGIHIEKLLFKTKDWMKRKISIPPLPEQQKIAEILSTQDKLIELQEKKIEQLKELKKAYLQKMFPQKGSKYPELRFKGFSDPWEQRKVSDITSVASFKPYLSDANDDGEYEVIQQGDTPILGYADGKPFTEYEKTTLFGDHTLSLYKTKSPFFVASDGLKILYSEGMDGYFYYYLLEKYKPESEGYKRHFSILKECECSFPISKEEQEKIGAYFSQLDTLITLHQRKSEQEKQKKKALMQLLLTGKVRCK